MGFDAGLPKVGKNLGLTPIHSGHSAVILELLKSGLFRVVESVASFLSFDICNCPNAFYSSHPLTEWIRRRMPLSFLFQTPLLCVPVVKHENKISPTMLWASTTAMTDVQEILGLPDKIESWGEASDIKCDASSIWKVNTSHGSLLLRIYVPGQHEGKYWCRRSWSPTQETNDVYMDHTKEWKGLADGMSS